MAAVILVYLTMRHESSLRRITGFNHIVTSRFVQLSHINSSPAIDKVTPDSPDEVQWDNLENTRTAISSTESPTLDEPQQDIIDDIVNMVTSDDYDSPDGTQWNNLQNASSWITTIESSSNKAQEDIIDDISQSTQAMKNEDVTSSIPVCPRRKPVVYTDDGQRQIPPELYQMAPTVRTNLIL